MNDSTATEPPRPQPQYKQLLALIGVRYRDRSQYDRMVADADGELPWVAGEKVDIAPNHDDNRVLALCQVVDDLTYDHANGRRVATIDGKQHDFRLNDEVLTATLIRAALDHMRIPPLQSITAAYSWASSLTRFGQLARSVDSIFDETKAAITHGEARLKAEPALGRRCKPSRLLFEAFPYKPRLRYSEAKFAMLMGRCMVRDSLALTLRPSFGNEPLIPQLMYTLVDEEEGGGKSSFCYVWAGGAVGDVGGHPRFNDAISIAAIIGNPNHGQNQLAAYAAGRTVNEWADKTFGAYNEMQANALKAYANSGTIRWRDIYGRGWLKVNKRAIDINTTNSEAILTIYLGVRRLPILNLKLWRQNRTAPASVIAQNHNTGLNWLAEHRDVILALGYREGLWRHSLAPPAPLLAMMYARSESYTRQENWQMLLELALARFNQELLDAPNDVIGLPVTQLSRWAVAVVGARAPLPNAMGRFLTGLGWGAVDRHVRSTANKPERMRVLEGEGAKQRREAAGGKEPIVTRVLMYSEGLGGFRGQKASEYDERNKLNKGDEMGPF
jgi:hypothetical protein